MSVGWLERYRAGDRDRVWHELQQLGFVSETEDVVEVSAVCDEMARRARRNVEVLVGRLEADGYRFHSNDDEQVPVEPWLPASEAAAQLVGWLTVEFGAIPFTLSSWVRHVGDVWLVGTHPSWDGADQTDPLVVQVEGLRWPGASIREFYRGEADAWRDCIEAGGQEPSPMVLPVSPDHLHKANVSGGAPYGFRVPDGCADGLFVGEVAVPFVEYLNHAFRQGGFLGTGRGQIPWGLRKELAEDLLAL